MINCKIISGSFLVVSAFAKFGKKNEKIRVESQGGDIKCTQNETVASD